MPVYITAIGDNAFHSGESNTSNKLSGVTSITLNLSRLTSIGAYTFRDCTGLTSVTLGESITTIGKEAFRNCEKLTEMTIPGSVTTMGNSIFYDCEALQSVYFAPVPDGSINTPISIGYDDIVVDNSRGSMFKRNKALTTVSLARNFKYADYSNLSSDNKYAPFSDCSSITSVNIHEGCDSISSYLFNQCTGLTSVTISNSVTKIGESAFRECTGLTQITCLAITPPTVGGSNTFLNVTKTIPVNVPGTSVSAYQAAYGWKEFFNFQNLKANVTTNKVYYLDFSNVWEVNNGTLHAIFTNANTDIEVTVKGEIENSSAIFYLAEGNSLASTGVSNATYTHIEFTLTNVTRSNEATLTTGALYLADADKYIYNLATNEWVGVNQATDIEETVTESAIEVRDDVVTALGDIYVYNMSGIMVAHDRDEIDLSALSRGIYLIHAGGAVKKVVR